MKIKQAQGLTTRVYQDALQIRKKVFVEEQHVSLTLEIDQKDAIANNYVGYLSNLAVTTARTIKAADGGWHIQRVCTLQEYRHQGHAAQLLKLIIATARTNEAPYLILDAQLTAQPFYEKLGFKPTARAHFLDAGIVHQEMKLTLN